MIEADHDTISSPSEIKLRVKALQKFIPYNGFFPVQRSLELVRLFHECYSASIDIQGTDRGLLACHRPIHSALFAPGILYNTIKSGIAVDYPIMTGSYPTTHGFTNSAYVKGINAGSAGNTVAYDQLNEGAVNGDWHFRVPFETILTPEAFLAKKKVVDAEPDQRMHINVTNSLSAPNSAKYSMASHNFFAESINFFLKDSELTSLESLPEDDMNFGNAVEGQTYRMRIVCSDRKYKNYATIIDPNTAIGKSKISASFSDPGTWNPRTVDHYFDKMSVYNGLSIFPDRGYTFGPPSQRNAMFSLYNHPSYIFGALGGGAGPATGSSADFRPHTPPHYDGYCHVDISWTAPRTDKFSLDEILNSATAVYHREASWGTASVDINGSQNHSDLKSWNPGTGDTYWNSSERNAMQLSSSFNLFQKSFELPVQYDAEGNPLTVGGTRNNFGKWVIQPKFETPILTTDHQSTTTGGSYESGLAGIGHTYMDIPPANAGLFVEIQDLPDSNFAYEQPSLADLVGFKKESQQIGQLPEFRTVSEAIVAIPFLQNGSQKQFLKIEPTLFDLLKSQVELGKNTPIPAESVVNMIKTMGKYVIPPKMDFLTNTKIKPFAMYFFEFEHTFDKQDLAHIWQNLMPKTEPTLAEATATLGHELGPMSLLKNIPKNLKWMVFKVKQKAEKNYYAKTADSADDTRFKFKFKKKGSKTLAPDYSYNWPYDYFSLVELAKLDVGITIGGPPSEKNPEDHSKVKVNPNTLGPVDTGLPVLPTSIPGPPPDAEKETGFSEGIPGGPGSPPADVPGGGGGPGEPIF